VVKVGAVEQQVTIVTLAGAATDVRIGRLTPLLIAPISAGTPWTSTRCLAASTPTVDCP